MLKTKRVDESVETLRPTGMENGSPDGHGMINDRAFDQGMGRVGPEVALRMHTPRQVKLRVKKFTGPLDEAEADKRDL